MSEFIEFCAELGFTTTPRVLDSEVAADIDALDKEWLAKQSQVAGALQRLRAHVRETGGHAPTAYPSGALLSKMRKDLGALTKQLGAYARGQAVNASVVVELLDEVFRTVDRVDVAIAVERAGGGREELE